MKTGKKVIVIGSGFAGLSAAALLAKEGHDVTILEKNTRPGGRARVWESDGFVFDMGPSWYWMPEVFENYYNLFGRTTSDFYQLNRLDPGYRIYYRDDEKIDVPASPDALAEIFEQKEKGSGQKLKAFIADAKYKYETAMSEYVWRISDSIMEYADLKLLIKAFQLRIFQSFRSEVRAKFSHPSLVSLIEFPVLFLGSTPDSTPAMYSMMNYADLVLGTWYPMGGMHRIVDAFVNIASASGAKLLTEQEVVKIDVENSKARYVRTKDHVYEADIVVAGSDYHHTEQTLLDPEHRTYSADYWDKRTMSPSSLIFYLGVNKKLPGLLHHNLFFDADFESHATEIYKTPRWPSDPLFYVCATSVTDPSTAPEGMENIFILMPLAPGIEDTEELRRKYFEVIIKRIEAKIGIVFRDNIIVNRSYCATDFERDYHSFKGNAYGLANTLKQTAILKPKMRSAKVKNLFYTGQLTVPGPGVPPAIISGQIVSKEINRQVEKNII
jgi:phytoene desaturase